MVWTCENGRGGVLGEMRVGGATASGEAWEIVEWLCDGGYELVGSGGTCHTGSKDVEGSHHPSNTIPDGKIRMINGNDDDQRLWVLTARHFALCHTTTLCRISILAKESNKAKIFKFLFTQCFNKINKKFGKTAIQPYVAIIKVIYRTSSNLEYLVRTN